jgi:hypothetical protein
MMAAFVCKFDAFSEGMAVNRDHFAFIYSHLVAHANFRDKFVSKAVENLGFLTGSNVLRWKLINEELKKSLFLPIQL